VNLLFAGAFLLVVFLVSATNWRRATFVALVVVVVEGVLRKWVVPSASEAVYFLKDFILLGAYVGFLFSHRKERLSTQFPGLVALFLVANLLYLGVQVVHPNTGSVVVALLGLRNYLIYLPLAFLVPLLFPTITSLEGFLRRYLFLVIACGLLGVLQFRAPPDSWINAYADTSTTEATDVRVAKLILESGEVRMRVPGPFAYHGGYFIFLVSMLALYLPFLGWTRSRNWRLAYIGTIVLMLGNVAMTGTRSAAVASIMLVLVMAIGAFTWQHRSTALNGWHYVLLTLLALAGALIFFDDAILGVRKRITDDEQSAYRLVLGLDEVRGVVRDSGFLGYGMGTKAQGLWVLYRVLGVPEPLRPPPSPESEMGRIFVELGGVGFFLWYGLRLSLIFALVRCAVGMQSGLLRLLALAAACVHFYTIFAQMVFSPVSNLFCWFFAGFLLLLPKLDAGKEVLDIENEPRLFRGLAVRSAHRATRGVRAKHPSFRACCGEPRKSRWSGLPR
jgi:hypothetical protein